MKCHNCQRPLKHWNQKWKATVYGMNKIETYYKNMCICGTVTDCHNKFHKIYGTKNNNRFQLIEFLGNKEAVIY